MQKLRVLSRSIFVVSKEPLGSAVEKDVGDMYRPFKADRAKYSKTECHFDPLPFLPPFEALCYLTPDFLETTLPTNVLPFGRVRGSRREVAKYVQQWDAKGALRLFRTDEVPEIFRTQLIALLSRIARSSIVEPPMLYSCL